MIHDFMSKQSVSMIKEELKVFITNRESVCDECKENLGHGAWILLNREKRALCLSCAELDHLEFLPSGDAALTRRARKYSSLYAVVLKWSRTRKQYERQGLLVQEKALEKAEAECLKDADIREHRKAREAEKRQELDQEYIHLFAGRIRELYPHCPSGTENLVAVHACKKYSGRVGRSAAAKSLNESAVTLAVKAYIRHTLTDYDSLLLKGYERWDARESVRAEVNRIMDKWVPM